MTGIIHNTVPGGTRYSELALASSLARFLLSLALFKRERPEQPGTVTTTV